ncbi:MAG: hypothetical protein QF351_02600, partial [Phycisphaerales bacterium]|nr:hypothetical protein [Phycisphaerales bacterium]
DWRAVDAEPEPLTGQVLVLGDAAGLAGEYESVETLPETLDGDTTALHLAKQIEPFDIRVTRLARGLPSGGTLEQASVSVLADAMDDRRPLGGETP